MSKQKAGSQNANTITLTALLKVNPDLIIRFDRQGKQLEVIEPKGWHSFDLEKIKQSGSVIKQLPAALAQQFLDTIGQALLEGKMQSFEYELAISDKVFYRECRMVPSQEEEVIAIIRDITESKETKMLLEQIADGVTYSAGMDYLKNLVQSIVNIFDPAVVMVGKINYADSLVEVITGRRNGKEVRPYQYSLAGTPCEGVLKKELCFFPERVWERFPEDKPLADLQIESYVGIPLTNSQGTVIGLITILDRKVIRRPDIFEAIFKIMAARAAAEMERLEIEQRIWQMAYHDRVTDLPNRWRLTEYIEELIAGAAEHSNIAVMFLSVEGLKQVSSRFGYMFRDELLQLISQSLIGVAEDCGLFVARFDSEEFVFVCTCPKLEGCLLQAGENIVKLFDTVWGPVSGDYQLQANIGIALFPEHGRTVDDLLKRAEIATYKYKGQQTTKVNFYTRKLTEEIHQKWVLETELRNALRRNQFALRYQPQVHGITGKIQGVEALVRWVHPEKGLLPPAVFLPVMEETGLIQPLGEWILQEACRQAGQWFEAGMPTKIAVNISAKQFLEPEFISQVKNTLEQYQLPAGLLQLEITESAAIDVANALPKLQSLRDTGVGISLDDFGTGYSSLAYLRNFPIHALKIDKGFVREMLESDGKDCIVDMIISLSKSLGVEVIAEGVETQEQVNMLIEKGCHIMQGYLFARPVTSDEIEKFQGKITL